MKKFVAAMLTVAMMISCMGILAGCAKDDAATSPAASDAVVSAEA